MVKWAWHRYRDLFWGNHSWHVRFLTLLVTIYLVKWLATFLVIGAWLAWERLR